MKFLVLLNEVAVARGGHNPKLIGDRVARGFADAGVEVDVRLAAAPALVKEAAGALLSDIGGIIVGGGDGTFNAVVNATSEGHKVLGVLPMGKHNHFARHMGIPTDLDDAIAALARGKMVEMSVAEVNGRIFLNCSAIGLNPLAERDGWSTVLVGMLRKLTGRSIKHVRVRARGHTFATDTSAVIVCNNSHQMESLGVRPAAPPEPGLLNVYVASAGKRRKRFGFLPVRKTSGHTASHFNAMALPDVRIESPRRRIAVSIDGEWYDLRPPLHFHVRPRPLRVLAPAVLAPPILL